MATAYANSIRAALLNALQTDLPPMLSALGLDPIATWESKRVGDPSSAETPAVVLRFAGWRQPYDDEHASDAGVYTQSTSIYRFLVFVFASGPDEERIDEELAAYAEAVRAVLDDVNNCDLGGVVEDMHPDEAVTSPAISMSGDERYFRAVQIPVRIWKTRTVGTYSS